MENNELMHYGVLGMKWGVRKYQNYDGSYTQAGLKRYKESLGKYEDANAHYKTAKKKLGHLLKMLQMQDRLERKQNASCQKISNI